MAPTHAAIGAAGARAALALLCMLLTGPLSVSPLAVPSLPSASTNLAWQTKAHSDFYHTTPTQLPVLTNTQKRAVIHVQRSIRTDTHPVNRQDMHEDYDLINANHQLFNSGMEEYSNLSSIVHPKYNNNTQINYKNHSIIIRNLLNNRNNNNVSVVHSDNRKTIESVNSASSAKQEREPSITISSSISNFPTKPTRTTTSIPSTSLSDYDSPNSILTVVPEINEPNGDYADDNVNFSNISDSVTTTRTPTIIDHEKMNYKKVKSIYKEYGEFN